MSICLPANGQVELKNAFPFRNGGVGMSATRRVGYTVPIHVFLTVWLNACEAGATSNTEIETYASYNFIHSIDPWLCDHRVCQWSRT